MIGVERALALSALAGMIAGLSACASADGASSKVPGAPSADPEGSVPGAIAPVVAREKNGCKSSNGCTAKMVPATAADAGTSPLR